MKQRLPRFAAIEIAALAAIATLTALAGMPPGALGADAPNATEAPTAPDAASAPHAGSAPDAASAPAAETGPSMFSLSGFGTLGEVHSSEHRADFVASVFQPNGAGYTRDWSPEVDSLVGAQLSIRITPALSAVVQVIAQQNYDGTFRPHVEWANLKYQFTPDFSVRVGRAELPTFLFSDTRNVGYTYAWVRPPIELYSLLPLKASDGAGFSYRVNLRDVSNTTQGSFVQSDSSEPDHGGRSFARDSFNFSNTTEFGSLTLHVSYQHTRLTLTSLDGFFDAFEAFGPQGMAIADKYTADGKVVATSVLGASYDPGHWFVISEWARARLNSFLGDIRAWYVSGGVRVGRFTPYATYGHEHGASNSDPGLLLTGLPPAQAAYASGLNAGLNALLESIPRQSTVSVGARWDFKRNLDFKLQADHTRMGADSYGTLINIQPGLRLGGTVNLISVTVDFVF